jgi:hypothetical protein
MRPFSSERPAIHLGWTLGAAVVLSQFAGARGSGTPALQLVGPQRELSTQEIDEVAWPQVTWNSTHGEFYVTWTHFDLFGAAVSVDGLRRTGPTLLYAGTHSATASGLAYAPTNDRYLATFLSQDGTFTGFETAVGIVLDSDGNPQGAAAPVCMGSKEGALVYNPVADEYFYQGRSLITQVRAQRITIDGTPLVPGDIPIENTGSPAPSYEVVHASVSNRYLATWRDQADEDAKGLILGADGSTIAGPFVVLSFFSGSSAAAIGTAYDPSRDRFLVAATHADGTAFDAVLIDTAGNTVGSTIALPAGPKPRQCSVAYDESFDAYIIAWTEDRDRLCIRLIDGEGDLLGAETEITSRYASMPMVRGNGAGRALLTWRDERDEDVDDSVHVRTLALAISDDGLSSFCGCDAGSPCGNTATGSGCANSTGAGALLAGAGSTSVAADDLVLSLSSMPANQSGLLFMGSGTGAVPSGDGLRCVTPGALGTFRFPVQGSGAAGEIVLGPGIAALSAGFDQPTGAIASGSTWYFQGWYRDPNGPCSSTFNLSNALAVSFVP